MEMLGQAINETEHKGDPKEDVVVREKENEENDVNVKKDDNMFSDANIGESSSFANGKSDITITPEEKAAFIDSVATNSRFTKEYSIFGGRINITIRSLTSDEVNALATWTARQGTNDPSGLVSGKYRKYLLAAQVAMMNGVEMPPLEEPLYEHIGSDGKTVDPPGWISRCSYWDNLGFGQFQAIIECIKDFDARYSILCSKAEDSNFWNPDTP